VEKYFEREKDGSAIGGRWSAQIVPNWRRGRFEYKPFTDFNRVYICCQQFQTSKSLRKSGLPGSLFHR